METARQKKSIQVLAVPASTPGSTIDTTASVNAPPVTTLSVTSVSAHRVATTKAYPTKAKAMKAFKHKEGCPCTERLVWPCICVLHQDPDDGKWRWM